MSIIEEPIPENPEPLKWETCGNSFNCFSKRIEEKCKRMVFKAFSMKELIN